jgi:hypothetical protein
MFNLAIQQLAIYSFGKAATCIFVSWHHLDKQCLIWQSGNLRLGPREEMKNRREKKDLHTMFALDLLIPKGPFTCAISLCVFAV